MFVLDIIEVCLAEFYVLTNVAKNPSTKVASTIYTCGAKVRPPVHVSIVRDSSSESSTLASVEASAPFSPSASSEAEGSLRTPVPSSLAAVSPCWDGVLDDGWSACTPAGRNGGPSSSLSSWKRKVSHNSMSCGLMLAIDPKSQAIMQ